MPGKPPASPEASFEAFLGWRFNHPRGLPGRYYLKDIATFLGYRTIRGIRNICFRLHLPILKECAPIGRLGALHDCTYRRQRCHEYLASKHHAQALLTELALVTLAHQNRHDFRPRQGVYRVARRLMHRSRRPTYAVPR